MRLLQLSLSMLCLLAGLVVPVHAADIAVGQPVPDFSLMSDSGQTVTLSDFRGRPVVLEWTNHDCPFVRKHYSSGNMQRTQRALTEDGAIWLSIISSAPGKQGHVSAAESQALTTSRAAYPSYVLMDPDGTTGAAYDARTTPHMYLISADGILVYKGAIDDKPSARQSSLKGAKNYVLSAWNAYQQGQTPEVATTKPYGCSVKYAD